MSKSNIPLGFTPSKDWTGNQVAYVVTNGFANNNKHDRADNDYYATEPKATELLLQLELFDNVWEVACGGGGIWQMYCYNITY